MAVHQRLFAQFCCYDGGGGAAVVWHTNGHTNGSISCGRDSRPRSCLPLCGWKLQAAAGNVVVYVASRSVEPSFAQHVRSPSSPHFLSPPPLPRSPPSFPKVMCAAMKMARRSRGPKPPHVSNRMRRAGEIHLVPLLYMPRQALTIRMQLPLIHRLINAHGFVRTTLRAQHAVTTLSSWRMRLSIQSCTC